MLPFPRFPGRLTACLLVLAPILAARQQSSGGAGPIDSPFTVALFSARPPLGDAPLSVSFVDRSLGEPTSWLWDFGDGTHSSLQNPTHVYGEAGVYTVRLTASGPRGSDTLEKWNGVIVRSCSMGSARDNTVVPLERGEDFVPITGDDSLGFYCVYSGKAANDNGTGISNNVGMFLFPLVDGEILLFGSGYGDRNSLVSPTNDAAYDVRRVDAIIRFCLGRRPELTPIRFVAPHGHIDHINADCIRELRKRGYPILEIAFHSADATASRSLPGWTNADRALFRTLRSATSQCQEELSAWESPLGKIWLYLRDGHTPGSIDLVIDVEDDPTNRFVVRGSGAVFGACSIPNVREAVEPHGNLRFHAPEPVLTALAPDHGSSLGGTSVVVSGQGFAATLAGPPRVFFDGVLATAVTVLDDDTLTCTAPPGIPGERVDVRILNRNGQSVRAAAFRYRALPTLGGLTPANGVVTGGTRVTVSGTGFLADAAGTNSVRFDGALATAVQVIDDRTLACTTPSGQLGPANVTLANTNGTAERAGAFRYDPPIDVTGVVPALGSSRGGLQIQVNGAHFATGASVPQVFFGLAAATNVVRVSDTRLTCTTPPGPAGTNVDVRVSGENGSDVLTGGFRYFVQPQVTAVSPAGGPALAATPVTLTGSNFTKNNAGANTVTFGGSPATAVVAVSDTSIQCLAPSGLAGSAVDVVVSNANGAGTLAQGFRYRRTPGLSALAPPGGPRTGGTLVTLTGSAFLEPGAGATSITFGGQPASAVVIVDDTTLTCRTPPSAVDATVDVVVRNDNGQALLPHAFRYSTRPILTGLTPAAAPGGALVTLHGAGFRAPGAGVTEVRFGALLAERVQVLGDDTLSCRAPLGRPGTVVDVRLANQNGTASLGNAFRYLQPPRVRAVSPSEGPSVGGDRVVLHGEGFAGPQAPEVRFDGVLASAVVVRSDTELSCTTPPGARGAADVSLRTAGGTGVLHDGYTYKPLRPVLASVDPAHGPGQGGTRVVLTGSGFTSSAAGPCTVRFGAFPATEVVVPADGRLVCLAPAGAPGTLVDVQLSNASGVATLVGAYRYHLQPALSTLTPPDGSPTGGTSVTLHGSGFSLDDAGVPAVRFGGQPASTVLVVDDATLTCLAPGGTTGAVVDVELVNANGSARLASAFRYLGAPTLASVLPVAGTPVGGTLVTLSGTGFTLAAAGTFTVRFGGSLATQLTLVDDGTLTCRAPPGTGGASVDVQLANANGTATLPAAYRYFAGPEITQMAPGSGPSSGGTIVVLTGKGFRTGVVGPNTVLFGTLPASSVTTVDDSRVRAVSPAGTAGTSVELRLTNSNGSVLAPASFRYHAAPTLTSFLPAGSSAAGGVTVTLHGSGFQRDGAGANQVLFGATPASAISVLDDATLTCVAPAGSGGSGAFLSVTNANGGAAAGTPFRYFAPPRVDELVPPQGFSGGGTLVEVRGAGFALDGAGTSTVWFGARQATEVTPLDDATLQCRTPSGSTGPVAVRVDNANGSGTRLDGFYYDWAPTLTGLLPVGGTSLGGTEVALTGGGFATAGAGPLSVRFGANLAMNVRVQSGGALLCTSPSGPAGTLVDVVVSNSRGSSTLTGFQYRTGPTLTSISPATGPPAGGTLVTLRGTGFLANAAGPASVRFGSVAATSVTVLDDTTVRCTAPSGPARTSATVTLDNANGSASFANGFRWLVRDPGDVNDDGVADALLAGSDAVYLFFGDELGLADKSTTSANLTVRPSFAGTDFGAQVVSGDLNGDQIADLVVSAPGDDVGGTDAGAVFVFHGPLLASPTPRLSSSANAVFRGASAGDRFGSALLVRDLTGDGKNDLVVGAPLSDAPGLDGGAVYLYRGGATFASQTTAQAAVRLLAADPQHNFGAALAAGDANGDGQADLLVGAPLVGSLSGAAYLFRGGATLASATAAAALVEIDGKDNGDRLGTSVALCDFDGDGDADLFLGAPEARNGGVQGGLLYHYEGGTGLSSGRADGADVILTPEASGDRLGQALAAGDVDGDGRAELLVGTPQHDLPATNAGRAYLLRGGALSNGTIAQRAFMIIVAENSAGDQLGSSLALSDIDADGRLDLLVGSPFSNGGGSDSGRSYVFSGAQLQATRSGGADDVTFTGASAGLLIGREIGAP